MYIRKKKYIKELHCYNCNTPIVPYDYEVSEDGVIVYYACGNCYKRFFITYEPVEYYIIEDNKYIEAK